MDRGVVTAPGSPRSTRRLAETRRVADHQLGAKLFQRRSVPVGPGARLEVGAGLVHPLRQLAGKALLGHGIEDSVFLVDVGAQQRGIAVRRRQELFPLRFSPGGGALRQPGECTDLAATRLVVVEHHADGAEVAREARLDHGSEEHVLLLGVVKGVGELADEPDESAELGSSPPAAADPVGECDQGLGGTLDLAVFVHEGLDGFHAFSLLRVGAGTVAGRPRCGTGEKHVADQRAKYRNCYLFLTAVERGHRPAVGSAPKCRWRYPPLRMPLPIVTHDVHDKIVEEATQAVLSTVELETVLDRTGKLLERRFGETRVVIHRIDDQPLGKARTALVSDPRHPPSEVGTVFDLAGSAAGRAVETRQPVVVDRIDPERPRFKDEPRLAELGYGSVVSFPLVFEDQVLGVLEIAHPPREGLLDCCFQVARQVSSLVAIALHNSLLVDEVRRLNRLLGTENALLKEELRQVRRDARYLAESAPMKAVLEQVRRVAASDTTVLVRGETGTGKEGLARMVHDLSPRFGSAFVPVNLGAIPDGLIESELFGHEKGAFTGAVRRRPGRFEQADGGTIFLDEVGDAPPPVQVRLLRVLQERELTRVGGTEVVRVDVRVVAATNRDLEKAVSAGAFRQDLYYRLAVFPIELPPLRQRRADLRPLAEHFLARHSAAMHRRAPQAPDSFWRALEAHPWPGNVRELENFVQRALILSPGPTLIAPDPLGGPLAPTAGSAPAGGPPGTFDEEARGIIERALKAAGGRVYGPRGAAALLGLKPTTLQGKMKRYRIGGTGRASPAKA